MAQPLCQNVPAFCLACVGTNNKFMAEQVLKRWKYILECKIGIDVVSFGADGDSRELKSMQVSSHLMAPSSIQPYGIVIPLGLFRTNCHSIRMKKTVYFKEAYCNSMCT